jgi:hypothetical protein
MKRLLSFAVAAALVPSAAGIASAAFKPTQFKIAPQNGSGETGTATLLQSGENLLVIVRTANGSAEPQPVHIHKGTCAKLDPKPAYPLTTLVNGKSESKIAGVKLADLEAGDYAINIHKSTSDIKTYVACGNLKVAAK